MPHFKLHIKKGNLVDHDEIGLDLRDLHQAYLEACKSIPDMARDLLISGQDPMVHAFIICDAKGQRLLEVPFDEILSPSEWRTPRAWSGPHSGVRSERARDDLALTSFRHMFSSLNVGCVLMTPELEVREMNAFGAAHSHVDAEAIRGTSILDIFAELKGKPKDDFAKFMLLARTGSVSEVIDLPYLVLNEVGETAHGWWNARVWPLFDENKHLLGLVEWAEPFTEPTGDGNTLVRIGKDSTR